MKRVLYIESAPQAGGSTISLLELVRRIDRRAFEPVLLLCSSNPHRQHFARLGITVLTTDSYCSVRTPAYPPALVQARSSALAGRLRSHRVTRSLWHAGGLLTRTLTGTWPLALTVRGIIRQQHIDLVHLNDAPELHKAGILASWLAGVPCICHVRSMPPLDALDRLLARRVTAFIFISRAVERDQRQRGLGNSPGTVIYNAVDLGPYAALDRTAARQAFGLADGDTVIGMMGRIEPWKGQRELLAALSLLAPRFPALRCLVAGAPELDGAWFKDELNALTRSLNLTGTVSFVGYQDVPRFMAALDLLVHASNRPEPFGRVLIEGMAAGLPIVASDAGGVPEIVIDGVTGLLVPPGQPAALAEAIAGLLAQPEKAKALGERGKERARCVFAIEAHVRAVEKIYQSILSG